MTTISYPCGMTREQWRALAVKQRMGLAARLQSDLLELWRSCKTKSCRRNQRCSGDGENCARRPWLADLNSPNLGRPDFRFNFRLPRKLRQRWAELEALPFR